ncbi:MAG TPA: type I phosphomannose isomerase catalytic subunit [Terriglobales bacterium]|nr:type I phosphomannose isomerase catalytic subunit [Terriglobales bacterium]
MPDLYPLLLKPTFATRPWGAKNLSPIYPQFPGAPGELIGEAWLSGDDCTVANGPLAGKKLGELVHEYGRALIGETAPQPDHFPLLMKFLFPKEKLSVQVHPDDEGAKKLGQPCGKTECWYVLASEPGATIGLGLKPGTTHAEFERAIKEVRAEHLLNWIPVKPGEMYYVDAGTVHAIGPGVILVETQQNSDTTFRLYDYGRPREIHVQQGLAAMREQTHAGKVLDAKSPVLVSSSCFVVEKHAAKGSQVFELGTQPAAQCLVAIAGCGIIECPGKDPVTFACGESVVVPAGVKATVRPQWEVEFIRAMVPAGQVKLSKTQLVSESTIV